MISGQVVDALATPVIGILADKYSTKKIWHLLGKTVIFSLTYYILFAILFLYYCS